MHRTRRREPRAAKQRDIARSVLPSTSRKGARRALRSIRRADRRAVKHALTTFREARIGLPEDGFGVCWCVPGRGSLTDTSSTIGCDLCGLTLPDYPLGEHLHAMSERRGHDRLGSLLRWAKTETDGMEPDRARRHLQRILPAGVIGTHAVTHLEGTVLPRQKWDWLLDRISANHDPN
jgi:hypothetical protein